MAAVALAERGPPETDVEAKWAVAAAMRAAAHTLGNTPAVVRSSYVSPAVVAQYREGRTLAQYRPRKLRIVSARATGLDSEEKRPSSGCCGRGGSVRPVRPPDGAHRLGAGRALTIWSRVAPTLRAVRMANSRLASPRTEWA